MTGPDGNVWFTEYRPQIGQITTTGEITEFPLPALPAPGDHHRSRRQPLVHRVGTNSRPHHHRRGDHFCPTTAGTGGSSPVPTATSGSPSKQQQDRQDHNRGLITEFTVPTAGSQPGIAAGPDGNLWFTEITGNKIGRITPAGVITEFPIRRRAPPRHQPGPDGNLWFAEYRPSFMATRGASRRPALLPSSRSQRRTVGRTELLLVLMATSGLPKRRALQTRSVVSPPRAAITEFSGAYGEHQRRKPSTSDADGGLWFAEFKGFGNRIGQLSLGMLYFTLPPCRVLDTRGASSPLGGPALDPAEPRSFPFAGVCGVPADAVVVSGNVTVVFSLGSGGLPRLRG